VNLVNNSQRRNFWYAEFKILKEVFILDYLRLPSGKKKGRYRQSPPEEFTAHLLSGFVKRHPYLSESIDRIFLATAVGTGGNMTRYISLAAEIPVEVPTVTIDAQCVGSYEAINTGYAYIRSGIADIVLVGGFESNSLIPERKFNKQDPRRTPEPYFYADFAPNSFGENSLIGTAELMAKELGISKAGMVDWSILSNERALKSTAEGLFSNVILPYRNNNQDETLKEVNVLERFKKRPTLIDASTSCLFDDGAGILLLASQNGSEKLQINPRFKILNTCSVGVYPIRTPIAFLDAIEKNNSQLKTHTNDIDLFEINESFALKPLLLNKLHNVSAEKINVLGGNLAFGHPFGASGAINLIHLLVSLQKSKKELGVVAASAAGGIGSSITVQQIN
jgi:acetyl-CoA C-acetyltransferase